MRNRFFVRAFQVAFSAIFAVMFVVPAHAQVPPDAEAIVAFDSAVTVEPTGAIAVTERITYRFAERRHGIFRDIPFRYDEGGKTLEAPVTVMSVTDGEGNDIETDVRREGNYVHIRIGDPDIYVDGTRVYVISYRVDGALKYFAEHDELYWDATGTGWSVPILSSTATVTLPPTVPVESIKTTCYTGAEGSTDQFCGSKVEGGLARFEHLAEGPLTIVTGWAPGVVAKLEPREIKPSAFAVFVKKATAVIAAAAAPIGAWYAGLQPGQRQLLWSFVLLLPILLPIRSLLRVWRDWRTVGRDPAGRETLVVEYAPPDGITPAEIEALVDERAENKGLWATIVDLAVRGYLTIKEVDPPAGKSGPDYEFTLTKDGAAYETLPPHELIVLKTLFGLERFSAPAAAAPRTRLSDAARDYRFNGKLPDIHVAVYQALVNRGYYDERPDKVRGKYAWQGGVSFFLGIIFGLGYLFVFLYPPMLFLLVVPVFMVGAGIVEIIVSRYMTRRTPAGVAAFEKAVGFREYMEKAETYRSRWQAEVGLFEKMLPYAIAFGVVDKWSSVFEGQEVAKPSWYEGNAWRAGTFDSRAFSGTLKGMDSSFRAAAHAMPPSSSSSGSGFSSGGGGGSSGGGRGGGGGGSW